ncbi:MAG TPA: AI-2E family transporter [Vicinamibacterales bacterium]|nr:AI-2E family transporter [Vicinamibacterales bacterium]
MTAGDGTPPTKSHRRRRGGGRRPGRRLAWIAAGLAVAVGLALARTIIVGALIVGVIAVFLAYLTAPVARLLTHRVRLRAQRPARHLATVIVLATTSVVFGVTWHLLGPRVSRQFDRFIVVAPDRLHVAAERVRSIERAFGRIGLPPGVRASATTFTDQFSSGLVIHALEALRQLRTATHYLPWLALTPVLAYLLLTQQPAFRRSALRLLPAGHLRWRGGEFVHDVNSTLAAYVRAQLTASLIVGALCSLAFALLGVPYPLVTGGASGALEVLPFVGPLGVAVLASSLQPVERALSVLVFLAALRLVQDYVIYPRLIRRGMHLPALVVIAAIWTGTEIGGLAGAFLVIPVAGVLAVAFRHWREYREIERLVRPS